MYKGRDPVTIWAVPEGAIQDGRVKSTRYIPTS